MKEKFIKKVGTMWDRAKEFLENSIPYLIITGILAFGGTVGYWIGRRKK